MHPDDRRPRLPPPMEDVRRAWRGLHAEVLPEVPPGVSPHVTAPDVSLVIVALSGGPDSLALAAALAFEAPRAGLTAGAIIVAHDLQEGSAGGAERAAAQARELGLDPVLVERVQVLGSGSRSGLGSGSSSGGESGSGSGTGG